MLTSDLFGNNQTQYKQSVAEGLMGNSDSPVAQAIIRRILMQRTDLLAKYGPSYVGQAVDDVAEFVGDWDEIGSSDVSGWVRRVEHNLKNKLNQYDEPMNVGDALDEQAATEGEKSPMVKDAQRADRIRSLKNLIAIAREQGRQLRVQELESELKKLQGVTEMDKSSPQPGRDGRVSHSTYGSRDKGGSKGTEREARPITAKKAAQHALDILKKQGVAEGLSDTQKKIEDTINKLEDRLKHAKSDEQWDNIKDRIERLQAGLKRSKQGVAEGEGGFDIEDMVMDQYRNGNEVWEIAQYLGIGEDEVQDIVDSNEQGVAEGLGNIGNAIKSLYQKIYRAGDDEIEYFYNASPIFAQYWDEYEGDLDSIIAEVDPEELAVIKAELESYAQDANLSEAPGAEKMILHPDTYELIDEYIAKIEPDADREEIAKSIISGHIHTSDLEYALQDEDLNEFAPPGSGDDDGGFDENTLKRLAAQWWNGDEDPRAESTLAAAGWEIGQDEGYDNGGVFVVRAGDENGNTYTSWPAEELEGLSESYPKHQDLSGISTEKLKAYLAKQAKQSVPGEGAQVKRVKAELQRREQGVAEDSQVNEISDRGLQNYRRQAHYAIQGHKFGSMKDAPNAAAIIAKREKGMDRASDKIVARKKAEDDKRLAVLVAKLPELKAEYEQMQAKYKSLGGSNWQYADREQNLSASEREARSMEGPMNNLWRQIQAAEKAQGLAEEWSEKYKRSIDCSNPRGFSQKAHCAGRNKNESEELNEQDLEEAVGTLELADFLFKGLEQKFPKIIQRYGHEVVGDAIMDVAEENQDVSSVSEVDMLIDDIIEKLQNYSGNNSGLAESTVSRLYYNVVGTSEPELRKDFGMRRDRRGWFLSESSGRSRIMDAHRAFGSPKLVEYDLTGDGGGAATLGPDNVVSPIGTVPRGQQLNKKAKSKKV